MMGPLQAWQLEEPSLGEATRVPAESDRRRLREQAGPEARGGRTRARARRVHLHCAAQPRATGSHGCSAQCALARPRATGSHGRLCSAFRTLSESLHARGASNVRTPNGHTAHEHDGSAACRSTTSPMGGVLQRVAWQMCRWRHTAGHPGVQSTHVLWLQQELWNNSKHACGRSHSQGNDTALKYILQLCSPVPSCLRTTDMCDSMRTRNSFQHTLRAHQWAQLPRCHPHVAPALRVHPFVPDLWTSMPHRVLARAAHSHAQAQNY